MTFILKITMSMSMSMSTICSVRVNCVVVCLVQWLWAWKVSWSGAGHPEAWFCAVLLSQMPSTATTEASLHCGQEVTFFAGHGCCFLSGILPQFWLTDRFSAGESQCIWMTMQTFPASRHSKSESAFVGSCATKCSRRWEQLVILLTEHTF